MNVCVCTLCLRKQLTLYFRRHLSHFSSILITLVFLETGKDKGKDNVNLYSASSLTPLTHSDMDHTVSPANNTISAFTHKQAFPRQRHMHICIAANA